MAGTFVLGEQKIRPGAYFNIKKNDNNTGTAVVNGVTAVIFQSDFGPLCTGVELNSDNGYESVFGNGGTTDAIREAICGGAKTIIACRVGNGGTQAYAALNDSEGEEAVKISALYPGEKDFSVTVREKLTDASMKECVIYAGTTEFEKISFGVGEGEASALAAAMKASKNFKVQVMEGKEQAILANVLQSSFVDGTNPEVTIEDYSNAFAQVEPFVFNTICVDTEDTAVHLLLALYVKRIFDTGALVQAVVAEKHSVPLETRQSHAADFNDEKMNYVLNAHVMNQGQELDGYQTAARLAGMIGAAASNTSLTHAVIGSFTEILERLTNAQIISAEKNGCIVLSYNSKKQVWIDSAINTLMVPGENKDEGWKKIRRVKARFELIRRINEVTDNLIGKVDNDTNGISTVISQAQAVGDAMVAESKLLFCKITESEAYKADVDSAWFDADVIDKDSMEHIYMTFGFRFSTTIEE